MYNEQVSKLMKEVKQSIFEIESRPSNQLNRSRHQKSGKRSRKS